MATMNISLPDKMKEWVEEQVATGRYANASDYMRDLVRRDEGRAARQKPARQPPGLTAVARAGGASRQKPRTMATRHT